MSAKEKILVIGAGFAGWGAVAALLERGISPTVISVGSGASELSAGAADLLPWTAAPEGPESESELVSWARAQLLQWQLFPHGSAMVATGAGVIRRAAAAGAGVLALDPSRGGEIAVVDFERDDFEARSLARSYSCSAWAVATATRFVPVKLPGVIAEGERRYPLASFARIFDEPVRFSKLREAVALLHHQQPKWSALLFGPCLSREPSALEENFAIPIGEVLSPPDGSFGRRFLRARERWTQSQKIEILEERVTRVAADADSVRVEVGGAGREKASARLFDGVVIATGGLVGHGVSLSHSGDLPPELCADLRQPGIVSGARDGWDPLSNQGAWVLPPHYMLARGARADSRIQYAGDARSEVSAEAPGGTVLGAVISGKIAVSRLLA